MKKGARLRKILVLSFECPNCNTHFRFIYFEKTKFSKILITVLKLAPWAYIILSDFLSGGTKKKISKMPHYIEYKPIKKNFIKQNKEKKS